jgi:Myb-like DNA-binding domain
MKVKAVICSLTGENEACLDEMKMMTDCVSLGTKTKSIWTVDDDSALLKAVAHQHGEGEIQVDQHYEDETDWDEIALCISGQKSAVQCLKRYMKICGQVHSVLFQRHDESNENSNDVVQRSSSETNIEEVFLTQIEHHSKKKQKISHAERDHWDLEERSLLNKLVELYEDMTPRWNEIAANFVNRSALDCLTQWQQLTIPPTKVGKGSWTPNEDEILKEKTLLYGHKWAQIATHLPGRQGKQCRERYMNHLDHNLRKGEWADEEDLVLIAMQEIHGNKWASISKYLPGRSDNDIKKHWHSSIQKKFMLYGKDVSKTKQRCRHCYFFV